MIDKIFICFNNNISEDLLLKEFKDFKNVFTLMKSTREFMYSHEYDIANLPTSFLSEFGVAPGDVDCTVVDTGNKYNLCRFAVSSPNFIKSNLLQLSNRELAWYQIVKPFEAALNFSEEINENLSYAVHTEYAFSYLNFD